MLVTNFIHLFVIFHFYLNQNAQKITKLKMNSAKKVGKLSKAIISKFEPVLDENGSTVVCKIPKYIDEVNSQPDEVSV